MLRDVESYARRQPWIVAAGGFVVGMFASRFLKASSANGYARRTNGTVQGSSSGVYVAAGSAPAGELSSAGGGGASGAA
jgi:hypothetical protein